MENKFEVEGVVPISNQGELVAIVHTLPGESRRQVFYKVVECKQSDITQLLTMISDGK